MSFEDRIAARSEVLVETMGESGLWFNDTRSLPVTGLFQWAWSSDVASGMAIDRRAATLRMLTADAEELGLAAGHYMEFRDRQFRVVGSMPGDAGMTMVQLSEFVQE
jgi:hypothetical protein